MCGYAVTHWLPVMGSAPESGVGDPSYGKSQWTLLLLAVMVPQDFQTCDQWAGCMDCVQRKVHPTSFPYLLFRSSLCRLGVPSVSEQVTQTSELGLSEHQLIGALSSAGSSESTERTMKAREKQGAESNGKTQMLIFLKQKAK